MSPVRLLVLALLFYIGYRLLIGMSKKKPADKPSQKSSDENASPQVSDVLVEDPVCHTLVPQGQAVRLQHKNQLYYFCSEACCSQFLNEKGEEK
jgi:YHS domain-containing protein